MVSDAYNSRAGKVKTGRSLDLNSQPFWPNRRAPGTLKDPTKKSVKYSRRRHSTPTSGFHTHVHTYMHSSRDCWNRPFGPVLRRLRQGNYKLKACLSFEVTSRPVWAAWSDCLKEGRTVGAACGVWSLQPPRSGSGGRSTAQGSNPQGVTGLSVNS